jgi:hypothetical protein
MISGATKYLRYFHRRVELLRLSLIQTVHYSSTPQLKELLLPQLKDLLPPFDQIYSLSIAGNLSVDRTFKY